MRPPTNASTFWAAALAVFTFTAQASTSERKPVLQYVKPGADVTFVSQVQGDQRGLDGWKFLLDRWSEFTTEEIQQVEGKGHRVALEFTDGKFSGQGPCNSISGTYDREENALRFGAIARSKKMCANADVMAIEEKILAFLSQVTRMERSGSKLVLSTDNDHTMLFWGHQSPADSEGRTD